MSDSALRFLVKKRTTFTWIVPVGLLVATYFKGRWSPTAVAVGIVLLVLGEMVRFWAAGTIQKDNTIATTGPYAFVRNPLYFGSLLLAAGFTAISGLGLIAWLVVIGLFSLFHLAAIVYEERFLRTKFGEPYEQYLRTVPRLIPRPFPVRAGTESAATVSYSGAQALTNREHITAAITFATALVFVLLHILHGRGGY